jgi:predicted RNase H-like HicB family nuclease
MKLEYTVRIERLAESDDGGYLAIVPDARSAWMHVGRRNA